jgi:hypothetical protein
MLQSVFQHASAHDAQPDDGDFVCHVFLLWIASLARRPHTRVAFAMPRDAQHPLEQVLSRMLLTGCT